MLDPSAPPGTPANVLHELRVENLLLIERAELRLATGLNVLTGETGAGKTMLAHALDLLLGGRARNGIVRAGAAEAYVEGVFERPELPAELAERIPADAAELVLARRVWPDGRTRAYVCGRAATVGDLRELGGRLLAFYGQHEHRKLMLSAAQLDVLDSFCGPEQLELRRRAGIAYERVRELQQGCDRLRELAGARDRELDLVSFELSEIETVAPSEEEEAELAAQRERHRHLETLRAAATAGTQALAPEDGEGAASALAQAEAALEPLSGVDPDLAPLIERMQVLRYEAEDVGAELRRYLMGLEEQGGERGRLEAVEERLEVFARLKRKHGGTITDVLRHAEHCRARVRELEQAEVALEGAEAELTDAREELERLAGKLGTARRLGAPKLAAAVRARLGELAMPEAHFEVEVRQREDECGPRGTDAVELMIAPNQGIPAGPLREVASGGELSRVMLALLSVAHGEGASSRRSEQAGTDAMPLLVFDEVDAGIGGHTARAVGAHLRDLAGGRQILCITHLPQVAALASRHFTISKDPRAMPARTAVGTVEGEQLVGELVRMLGAEEGDRGASQHARELLRAA
jgi:DNA repair protein RecN (Recombination protein N)